MHIRGERGVHGVMKNVRHFRGDFGKLRKAVAGGSAGERVRGDVELFQILGLRLRLLQHAGILPQILQVFGSLLEEQLDRFVIGPVHRPPSTHGGARFSRGNRLAINAAIAEHHRFKFHRHVGERLRMAQDENSRPAPARRKSGAESRRRRSSEKYISTFMQKMQSILPT